MLLLKRRVGESIMIGGTIRVSVVEVRGGSVRLAIDAPGDLAVFRAELLDRLSEENARALAPPRAQGERDMQDSVITFPEGIPGMGDHQAFVLFDLDGPHRALVARDDPTLCLLLIDPISVYPDYPVDDAVSAYPFETEELAIASVLTRSLDESPPTVNLAAPIVIGLETKKAAQVILTDPRLSLRAPLVPRAEPEVRAP